MKKGVPLHSLPYLQWQGLETLSQTLHLKNATVVLKMDSIPTLLPVHLKRCRKESVECLATGNVAWPVSSVVTSLLRKQNVIYLILCLKNMSFLTNM